MARMEQRATPAQEKVMRYLDENGRAPGDGRSLRALGFCVARGWVAVQPAISPDRETVTPAGWEAMREIGKRDATAATIRRYNSANAEAAGRPAAEGSRPLTWGGEYDEDEVGEIPTPAQEAAPSVRLTDLDPRAKRFRATYGTELREVPDSDVLQLLALLDGGIKVTRKLFLLWEVAHPAVFQLDPLALDRAARAAIFYGLARGVYGTDGEPLVLRAEPIHLLAPDREAYEAVCGRRLRRAGHQRLRYTEDPAKATHDRCQLPKVGERARFRRTGATTGHVYDVSEIVDGLAKVWWDNPPEDYTEEINPRWVSWHSLERVEN